MNLLIIADDFTGALDTGVQLSKHSIPTTVMSTPNHTPILEKDCQVLVINADIRHESASNAFDCICRLLNTYADRFTHIYLKTDSALRGNISAVFAAALQTLQQPLCFIPAFPDLARTTKASTAYVDGQLLEQSVFRDDPRSPAFESSIPKIINRTHSVPYENISADHYDRFTQSSPKSGTVYLFDCETNDELNAIGDVLARHNLYGLTAGCAGFASTFVSQLHFNAKPFKGMNSHSPVLFVSGSANAVTLKQLVYAKENHYTVFPLSNHMFSNINYITNTLKDKDIYEDFQFRTIVKAAAEQLNNGQSVILATAVSKNELLPIKEMDQLQISQESIHNYIARYTSCLVKSIIDEMDRLQEQGAQADCLANLAVFGGDMVAAILNRLGCYQVRAAGEITSGVPLCQITYHNQPRRLVTKSGGFGAPDLIPVIERYLLEPEN